MSPGLLFPFLCTAFPSKGSTSEVQQGVGLFGPSLSWCSLSPALDSCSEWGDDGFGSFGLAVLLRGSREAEGSPCFGLSVESAWSLMS